jgi:hypothetical protein
MMSELHALLVETVPDVLRSDETAVSAEIAGGGLVAGERGEHFHQADCALVVGKAGVVAVDLETIRRRGLAACPVCEPNDPGT